MLTGADVVGVQVGEHTDLVPHTRHAVHHNALAGNFHDTAVTPGVGQLAQDTLQVVAFGGGVVQVVVMVGVVDAVGANHAHPVPGGFQHCLDHVGGGSLALGAGHADHGHLPGGVAEIGRRQHGHGVTGVVGFQDGHLGHGGDHLGGQIVLDDQRRRALGHHVGRKLMAVALGAHNADKKAAGGHFARVIVNVGYLGIQTALHQRVGKVLDQLFQKHDLYLTVSQNIRRTRRGK